MFLDFLSHHIPHVGESVVIHGEILLLHIKGDRILVGGGGEDQEFGCGVVPLGYIQEGVLLRGIRVCPKPCRKVKSIEIIEYNEDRWGVDRGDDGLELILDILKVGIRAIFIYLPTHCSSHSPDGSGFARSDIPIDEEEAISVLEGLSYLGVEIAGERGDIGLDEMLIHLGEGFLLKFLGDLPVSLYEFVDVVEDVTHVNTPRYRPHTVPSYNALLL